MRLRKKSLKNYVGLKAPKFPILAFCAPVNLKINEIAKLENEKKIVRT